MKPAGPAPRPQPQGAKRKQGTSPASTIYDKDAAVGRPDNYRAGTTNHQMKQTSSMSGAPDYTKGEGAGSGSGSGAGAGSGSGQSAGSGK